jgi:cell division protein FtsB
MRQPQEIGHAIPAAERRGFLSGLVRLNRYALLLLIIPFGVIGFWPDYKHLDQKRQRLGDTEQLRDSKKEELTRNQKKLDLINNDSEYLEVVARDRLQLQKDGEKVFRFEE